MVGGTLVSAPDGAILSGVLLDDYGALLAVRAVECRVRISHYLISLSRCAAMPKYVSSSSIPVARQRD
jgi:hypothetical protein